MLKQDWIVMLLALTAVFSLVWLVAGHYHFEPCC